MSKKTKVVAVMEMGLLTDVYSTDKDVEFELISRDEEWGDEDVEHYNKTLLRRIEKKIKEGKMYHIINDYF